jgi:Holliday junction resolvase RusA-like endonuclease
MKQTVFKSWGKNRAPKRRPWVERPRKDRAVLIEVNPKLKQKAYDRLAILRVFHRRLSQPGKLKTKKEVTENFLNELNSGVLWPAGAGTSVRHLARSTLYNWRGLYARGGIAALLPHYQAKPSNGHANFRPLVNPIEIKLAGRPTRRGKKNFIPRVKRHWKFAPLTCPIRLSIFYSFPIPKNTKMRRRMKMIRHQASHTSEPDLDRLNAFIISCMAGLVFKSHSQVVDFHSQKRFDWWPQTRVLITTLPG